MVLWMMGVGFENTCIVSGKQNEDAGSAQDFIFCFCVWCKSMELGGRVSSRFHCLTAVMEVSYLESCQTSKMELFCENSQRPKDVNYLRKKAPPQMFDWIPNAPPTGKVLQIRGLGRMQVHGICSRRPVCREVFETL